MTKIRKLLLTTAFSTALIFMSYPVLAAEGGASGDYQALKKEVAAMHAQMAEMQKLLKQQSLMLEKKTTPEISKAEVKALKKEVKKIAKKADDAGEWKDASSTIHMGGYGSAGYSNRKNQNGRFDQVQFSPIFHYQWKDLILLESELEFNLNADGSTALGMEYLTTNIFLNDYATFVVGKFLSPIGMFRQNLHPSWINKVPSKPVGFSGGSAAPVLEVGAQLRGAVPVKDTMRVNYAAYVGNGPELTVAGGRLATVVSDGFARDQDGAKVFGGRIGFLPVPALEIGVSGATGQVGVVAEGDRDYDVYDVDFSYAGKGFGVRGEYVEQDVGALAGSVAPNGESWTAYYLQGAYNLPYKLEAVLRYGDFQTPEVGKSQTQWVTGLNYIFAPQIIGKLAYEFNSGEAGSAADDDRFVAQISYGF